MIIGDLNLSVLFSMILFVHGWIDTRWSPTGRYIIVTMKVHILHPILKCFISCNGVLTKSLRGPVVELPDCLKGTAVYMNICHPL